MRVQLALNVTDLDEAVEFYSKMFNAEPFRVKPGYTSFAIDNPPLKLVLFEQPGEPGGSLNHLGVETETAAEVNVAAARIGAEGLDLSDIEDTACCFATKTETWVDGPKGHRWEWYVRTGDSDTLDNIVLEGQNGCCEPVDADSSADMATT